MREKLHVRFDEGRAFPTGRPALLYTLIDTDDETAVRGSCAWRAFVSAGTDGPSDLFGDAFVASRAPLAEGMKVANVTHSPLSGFRFFVLWPA